MSGEVYGWLVFAHVLLLVFWVGTDVGVFLAAKISERAELAVETRATVLKLGMTLDRMPRSALILIIPTGLLMASHLQLISLPGWAQPAIWIVAALWLAFLWAGFLNPETPLEQRAMLVNFAMNAILALGVTACAFLWLGSGTVPDWLAYKLLCVGLIFVAGVVLDVLFKPAVEVFVAIVTEGPTDERNAAYSRALRPVYWAVLTIYGLALAAAYLGVTK